MLCFKNHACYRFGHLAPVGAVTTHASAAGAELRSWLGGCRSVPLSALAWRWPARRAAPWLALLHARHACVSGRCATCRAKLRPRLPLSGHRGIFPALRFTYRGQESLPAVSRPSGLGLCGDGDISLPHLAPLQVTIGEPRSRSGYCHSNSSVSRQASPSYHLCTRVRAVANRIVPPHLNSLVCPFHDMTTARAPRHRLRFT